MRVKEQETETSLPHEFESAPRPAAATISAAAVRVASRDVVTFAAATLAAWAHTIDEIRIGEVIAVPFGIANAAVLAAWPRVGSRARAATAIAFGLFWGLAVIPYHILPLLGGAVTAQNVSGVSRLAAGAVMVALGVAIVRRRERD
jgi:hypothetical protein